MDINDQYFISNNDYEPCNHVIMARVLLQSDNWHLGNNLINIHSQNFSKNKYVMSSRLYQLLWTLDMKNDWQM